MTFASAQRPASLVLAGAASVLLLMGVVPVGVAVGVLGVLTAWLPVRTPPPSDLED